MQTSIASQEDGSSSTLGAVTFDVSAPREAREYDADAAANPRIVCVPSTLGHREVREMIVTPSWETSWPWLA